MTTVYRVRRKETLCSPIEVTFCQRCEQGLTQAVEGLRDYDLAESRLLPTDRIEYRWEDDFLPADYREAGGITATRIVPLEAALKPCPRSPDGQHLAQMST